MPTYTYTSLLLIFLPLVAGLDSTSACASTSYACLEVHRIYLSLSTFTYYMDVPTRTCGGAGRPNPMLRVRSEVLSPADISETMDKRRGNVRQWEERPKPRRQ